MFDIIGDIHGHASLLKKLLKEMGYKRGPSGYSHSERKVIFVGDFVNRGPEIRLTLQMIRNMTESGNAYAILGNHEVNAVLFHLEDAQKAPLLKKESIRSLSVGQTIQEFRNFPEEWKGHLKWLRSLPFYLEFENLRVVHACWMDNNIEILKNELQTIKKPKSIFRKLVSEPKSPLSQAILQTTRGIHHVLPPDIAIFDNRRRMHRFYRMRWWDDPTGLTFQENSFENKFTLPDYSIPPEILPVPAPYPEDAPPVFFGHYCRGNGPFIIKDNICCVDGCVTLKKRLIAYRWDGERVLDPEKIVIVRM
jgi:hypothetical protein